MTLLQSIRSLYSKTVQECDKSTDILSFLVGGSDTNKTCTITDVDSNSILSIDFSAAAQNALISVTRGEDQLIDNEMVSATDVDVFADELDALLAQYGLSDYLSYDKLVNNTNQSSNYYELLADITHGYTTNTRQDSATLIGLINSKNNLSLDDREKLCGLIQSAQDNGKVSQYGWMGILNSIYKETKENVEQGSSLEIVDGSPYVIKTAVQLVITVIETAIEVVLQILLALCNVFLRIVGIVFTAVREIITKAANTDISINIDDSTNYVLGSPVVYTYDPSNSHDTKIVYSSQYADHDYYDQYHNGIVQHSPGIDMYCWQPKSNNIILNGRLVVNIDPNRFKLYVSRRISFTAAEGNTAFKCDINSPLWPIHFTSDDENFFMTADEAVKAKLDVEYAGMALMTSLAAMGLAFFQNTGSITFKDPSYDHNNYTIYDLAALAAWCGYTSTLEDFNISTKVTLYRKMWFAIANASDNMTIANFSDDYTVTATGANTLGALYSSQATYSYVMPLDIFHCYCGCEINAIGTDNEALLFVARYNGNGSDPLVIDSVPNGYGFVPPQFSIDEIVIAVATVAALTTAAFIAGNILKKALRHKKRIKQLTKAQALNAKRDAYIADPTKQNAKALNKAVDKYNRQGRMFGWDEYDLTNNWFTPRSAIGMAGTANLFYGMDTNDTNVNYVIQLITGKTPR